MRIGFLLTGVLLIAEARFCANATGILADFCGADGFQRD